MPHKTDDVGYRGRESISRPPRAPEIGSIMISPAIAIIIITLFTRMNRASTARRMALIQSVRAARDGHNEEPPPFAPLLQKEGPFTASSDTGWETGGLGAGVTSALRAESAFGKRRPAEPIPAREHARRRCNLGLHVVEMCKWRMTDGAAARQG